ncbi:hypothetical protein [Streptomyces goshikiensis]
MPIEQFAEFREGVGVLGELVVEAVVSCGALDDFAGEVARLGVGVV